MACPLLAKYPKEVGVAFTVLLHHAEALRLHNPLILQQLRPLMLARACSGLFWTMCQVMTLVAPTGLQNRSKHYIIFVSEPSHE